MHFDWYQATIASTPQGIVDVAMASLDDAHDVDHMDRGGSGYTSTTLIRNKGRDTIATLLHGSKSAAPNLRGTSHNAVPVSAMIRKHWPKHAVSRLDVAEDMTADGLFGRIEDRMRAIALKSGLDSGLSYIPDCAEKGRTYRVGAPTSATLVRLYEKGLEQQGKGVADADPHHVRLEIQARPQKAAKLTFATLEPAAVWGSSKWTQVLAEHVMGLDVERLILRPREETELERTTAHVVYQFGKHAVKHGTVIAEHEHGLIEPTKRDAILMWCDRLATQMIRAEEDREAALKAAGGVL